MTNLRENYWAVEVPSMAFGFDINNYGNESELMYMLSMEDIADEPNSEETLITKQLPPGTWQLVCTTAGATYTHAAQIVEHINGGFADYNKGNFHHDLPFMSPFDSLRSLLEARGLGGKNYIIIKKG